MPPSASKTSWADVPAAAGEVALEHVEGLLRLDAGDLEGVGGLAAADLGDAEDGDGQHGPGEHDEAAAADQRTAEPVQERRSCRHICDMYCATCQQPAKDY